MRRDGGRTSLSAGGSLIADPPVALSALFRLWLVVEMGLLYIGAPLVMSWAIHTHRIPLVLVLQPVLLLFIIYLLWDRTFLMRRELAQGFPWRQLGGILATFVVIGGIVTLATIHFFPERFLGFPKYRPRLWLLIVTLYPLLSVIAQELVYRTFFFHRYGRLFGHATWAAVLVNGLLFGFGHVMFGNWIAVGGTMVIGCLLAYRYVRTGSLWAVWLEHSLYGDLVFTVGLGQFFFTGIATLG